MKKIYYYPITIEAFLLMVVAVYSIYPNISSNAIAAMLLFTMGLQNSLVTKISKSVVRTTHLTGILTDLGIEISQLLFEKNWENTRLLKLNIQIKLIIVSSFIMGGIVGGFTYFYFELLNLIFPAILLMVTILIDYLKTK